MKAVIIAGGWGTRLRPLTYNTCKSIIPVVNRPFVLHQIDLLKRYGIREIILNLHFWADKVKALLGDGSKFGVKIYYSYEKDPLGTCGAVKRAEEFFKKDADPIIVFNGDVLTDLDLEQMLKFHKTKKAQATLALTAVEDPTHYGLVITEGEGRIKEFIEKPSWEQVSTKNINAGIYILDPALFAGVPNDQVYSFERQFYPELLQRDVPMYGFESKSYWLDIGSPKKYMQAHHDILSETVLVQIPGEETRRKIWTEDGVSLDDSVELRGPSVFGKKVKIGAKTRVNEFCVIGPGVEIGEGCLIQQTIILEGAKIGKEAKLAGCIIGTNAVLEDQVEVGLGVVLADESVVKKGSRLPG